MRFSVRTVYFFCTVDFSETLSSLHTYTNEKCTLCECSLHRHICKLSITLYVKTERFVQNCALCLCDLLDLENLFTYDIGRNMPILCVKLPRMFETYLILSILVTMVNTH